MNHSFSTATSALYPTMFDRVTCKINLVSCVFTISDADVLIEFQPCVLSLAKREKD